MEKAANSDADQVIVDLEDAVAHDEKVEAREKFIRAVDEYDWDGKYLAVRNNGLRTGYAYGDIITLVENVGERLDAFVTAKVRTQEDIYVIDTLLTEVETAHDIESPVSLQPLIEETMAMGNLHDIAGASDRNESLIFGPGDYSASMGIDHPSARRGVTPYSGDIWHYPRFQIATAAAAHGLDAIDGAWSDFADTEGYRDDCRRAKAHGFGGKLAIHIDQVELANHEFTPTEEEIEYHRAALDALDEGEEAGLGAINFDGVMLDIAHRRHAHRTLDRARELGLVD